MPERVIKIVLMHIILLFIGALLLTNFIEGVKRDWNKPTVHDRLEQVTDQLDQLCIEHEQLLEFMRDTRGV